MWQMCGTPAEQMEAWIKALRVSGKLNHITYPLIVAARSPEGFRQKVPLILAAQVGSAVTGKMAAIAKVLEENNAISCVVATGGKKVQKAWYGPEGAGETEAGVIVRSLEIAKVGVPILREDISDNTHENMEYAIEALRQNGYNTTFAYIGCIYPVTARAIANAMAQGFAGARGFSVATIRGEDNPGWPHMGGSIAKLQMLNSLAWARDIVFGYVPIRMALGYITRYGDYPPVL